MANEQNTSNMPGRDTDQTSPGTSNSPDKKTGAQDSSTSTGQSTQANKTPGADVPNESVDKAASQVGEVLRGNTGAAKDAAVDAMTQAKDATGKVASRALGQVQEKATSQIDKQKSNLAQGLGSVAESIRQMGDGLKNSGEQTGVGKFTAQYGDSLAGQVEQLSNYLDKKEVRELVRDVETFARRNPALFIGGAFALGVLGARFLKSSSPNQALVASPQRRNIYNSEFNDQKEDSVKTSPRTHRTELNETHSAEDKSEDSDRKSSSL